MTLVRILCRVRNCGHELATIGGDIPHDVAGTIMVPPCPRHGGLRRGTFLAWARRRHQAGEELVVSVGHVIDLASLRPAIAEARRTGDAQVEVV